MPRRTQSPNVSGYYMTDPKIDSTSGEILAKWYLRFNGYFIVDNFIVHAGDDINRISKNIVGNHTETDILAIRHKFSKEITGSLLIQNDQKIINPQDNPIDFVIAEVKTGGQSKPNKLWTEKKLSVIEYILRFAGFIETEATISAVAIHLSEKGIYHDTDNKFSVRLVLISETKANKNWEHLTNILFDNIIDFLVDIRGQCWIEENIGIASIHNQWDNLINNVFNIANDHSIDLDNRKKNIKTLLQTPT